MSLRGALPRTLLGVLALTLAGCVSLPRAKLERAEAYAQAARPTTVECERADACALPSPLRALGDRALSESTPEAERNYALLLEAGQDSLLARVHLIRSARRSIDIQSFIYARDDAGYFVLNELLAAARRGVKVRMLLDQLFSVEDVQLLAALSAAHANFELRLYNPTFNDARTQPWEWLAGALLRFRSFNQRMHTKLLLIDDRVGITGGRNYQDRYFDWDPGYNYRDRDVLIAGPAAAPMAANFDAFWMHRRAVPVTRLNDVAGQLLRNEGPPKELPAPRVTHPERINAVSKAADDAVLIQAQLVDRALPVGRVEYLADLPDKHDGGRRATEDASYGLRDLIRGAEREVVLQTPYLVLSRDARKLFRAMNRRDDSPRVIVSTNSLASTDAFPVYALSHKYKRTYLRDLGFKIYEYKPFPEDAPIDVVATGALADHPDAALRMASESQRVFGSGSGARLVPLKSVGVRVGLHAKSIVVDSAVGVVGSHNFDPRSDRYNTESVVVVHDPVFAAELEAAILRDIQPENAWVIWRRVQDWTPVLSDLNYGAARVSEALPLFDLWPFRYATSYEYLGGDGCAPVPPADPKFRDCYQPVGDFPEVDLPTKSIYTRILTAFGAGLAPIL